MKNRTFCLEKWRAGWVDSFMDDRFRSIGDTRTIDLVKLQYRYFDFWDLSKLSFTAPNTCPSQIFVRSEIIDKTSCSCQSKIMIKTLRNLVLVIWSKTKISSNLAAENLALRHQLGYFCPSPDMVKSVFTRMCRRVIKYHTELLFIMCEVVL